MYLIPGFFGFANLGELPYFAHVKEYLEHALNEPDTEIEVIPVPTKPTSSLTSRALRLLEKIAETDQPGASIHLIGHSSGGLDARLLAAQDASFTEAVNVEDILSRLRSVVTISAPHRGTPVASFFTGILGQRLLQVLSIATIYVFRFGRLPLGVLGKLVAAFAKLDDVILNRTVLDQIADQLLSDFSADRRDAIAEFLKDVGEDQALIPQLMPDAMEVFNSTTKNRAGVRYGSVVTKGRGPGIGSTLAAGIDPYAHATHTLYIALHTLSSRMPANRIGTLDAEHGQLLHAAFGQIPAWTDSDGVVPTRSQPWGTLLHAANADHLDVIGHFSDPETHPPHYDWLASGTGFRLADFRALWRQVADFILELDLEEEPEVPDGT